MHCDDAAEQLTAAPFSGMLCVMVHFSGTRILSRALMTSSNADPRRDCAW